MTLQSVEMELARCFAPGQVYVALSRASGLEGLQVSGESEWGHKVCADPCVTKFYEDARADPATAITRERRKWRDIPFLLDSVASDS
jgi:hypothetical protein